MKTFNKILVALMGLVLFVSCGEEALYVAPTTSGDGNRPIVQVEYNQANRSLTANTMVQNTNGMATATTSQRGRLLSVKNDITLHDINFAPKAEVKIELTQDTIFVSKGEFSVPQLVQTEVVRNNKEVRNDSVYVEIEKIFSFNDGQVATANMKYDYTFMIDENSGDTLVLPHVEIDSVQFNNVFSEDLNSEELRTPHKNTLEFTTVYHMVAVNQGSDYVEPAVLRPHYIVVEEEEAEKVLKTEVFKTFIGCPREFVEVIEKITTNKRVFENKYRAKISFDYGTSQVIQNVLSQDTIFNDMSFGENKAKLLRRDTVNNFVMETYSGTYISVNTGKTNQTEIVNYVDYTYTVPVEFKSEYSEVEIPRDSTSVSFEEIGFVSEKVNGTWETMNLVQPRMGSCSYEQVEQKNNLILDKEAMTPKISWEFEVKWPNDAYNNLTKTVMIKAIRIKTLKGKEISRETVKEFAHFAFQLGELEGPERIYAKNANFVTEIEDKGETATIVKKGQYFSVEEFVHQYDFNTTNNDSETLSQFNSVILRSCIIKFHDSESGYSKTWNMRLMIQKETNPGSNKTYVDGDFNVSPYKLTLKGVAAPEANAEKEHLHFMTEVIIPIYVQK